MAMRTNNWMRKVYCGRSSGIRLLQPKNRFKSTLMDFSNKYPYLEISSLPRLPIPELKDTLNKYLETVKCLLTNEQYEKTTKVVDKFMNGKGPQLHKELKELASQTPTSWLEGFWDSMYLEGRWPITIHSNPCFGFRPDHARSSQTSRGAALTRGVVAFHIKIMTGKKEPDMERDVPLCMTQYGKLLCATRIPQANRDSLVNLATSSHIIVISRNQFYKVTVLNPINNNEIIEEEELRQILEAIVKDSYSREKPPSVGVLTNEERNTWASARQELLKANRRAMSAIETAIFALVLEDYSPKDRHEFSRMLLHGDGQNRFFDKSIQIIVGQPSGSSTEGLMNGVTAGINMEHSGFDGHSILYLAENVMKHCDSSCQVSSRSRELPPEKKVKLERFDDVASDNAPIGSVSLLQFQFSQQTLKDIKQAEKNIENLIGQTQSVCLDFEGFGKNFATKNKFSPDAFIQVAFQLAFYRLKGYPGSTYESANTKRYYHGRTETIRSCSQDSTKFCKVFLDPHASSKDKIASLKTACETHVKISNDCKNGQGIDRHLYGMLWLAKHNQQKFPNYELPEIFTDVAYPLMKTDLLSTSNSSGTSALTSFGFGPTSTYGFGLGYVVEDNAFRVVVSSFQGEAHKYAKELESSLVDIRKLLEDQHNTNSILN